VDRWQRETKRAERVKGKKKKKITKEDMYKKKTKINNNKQH